jgi:hypothetical protein
LILLKSIQVKAASCSARPALAVAVVLAAAVVVAAVGVVRVVAAVVATDWYLAIPDSGDGAEQDVLLQFCAIID